MKYILDIQSTHTITKNDEYIIMERLPKILDNFQLSNYDFVSNNTSLKEEVNFKTNDIDVSMSVTLKKDDKVIVWLSMENGGDGSISAQWYLKKQDAYDAQEDDEGWAEPCVERVETFMGSNIHKKAAERNARKN